MEMCFVVSVVTAVKVEIIYSSKCGFSKRIWTGYILIRWDDVLRWGLKEWKRDLKSTLCRLGWCVTIYNIWQHPNNIRHGNQILTKEKIVARIKWKVKTKVIATGIFIRSRKNIAICDSWGMYVKILIYAHDLPFT